MGCYLRRVLQFSSEEILCFVITRDNAAPSPRANPGSWPLLLYPDLLFDDIGHLSTQQLFTAYPVLDTVQEFGNKKASCCSYFG